jgi:hypothetical protein
LTTQAQAVGNFNYIRTVKAVLDNALEAVRIKMGLSVDEMNAALAGHLKTMTDEWFSGDVPNIAYGDPLCRFAYLYCHVAANANLFEVVIRNTPEVQQWITERLALNQELTVCAFGGGPGTELLGLSKHFLKIGRTAPPISLSFTILDRVPEWAETWNLIEREVTTYLRARFGAFTNRPFSIAKSFCPFDMTKVEQFGNLVHLFGQDFFVLNYVVSEILGDSQKLQDVIAKMTESAPPGAIFLIVDREQDDVMARAQNLLQTVLD